MSTASALSALVVAASAGRSDPHRALVRESDRGRAIGLGATVDDEGLSAPGWCTVAGAFARGQAGGPDRVEGVYAALLDDRGISFVAPIAIDADGRMSAPTSRLVVRFTREVDASSGAAILGLERAGEILMTDAFGLPGAFLVETGRRDGREVIELAARLAELPSVRFAEPERLFHGEPGSLPDDPFFSSLWGLHNTGQAEGCSGPTPLADADLDGPEAWELVSADPGLIVVVIDNGMQFDHPDLLADPALGADFTGQDGGGWPVHPCDNHGTSVAGCIAAIRGNGVGVAGIASGVRLASVHISNVNANCSTWTVNSTWVASALQWSVSIGARITNTSWRFVSSDVIADAYAAAADAGLLNFASAGNGYASSVGFPSSLPSVVAVGAIRRNGLRAGFSNTGVDLELVAPGDGILCPDRLGSPGYSPDDYACLSGTSFASPYAAGTAALMMSANPALSAAQVRSLLKTATVDLGPPGWDSGFGFGLPKASRAIRVALQPADLDFDGTVGPGDLSLLLGRWGETGPVGDLDGDGVVGASDLVILLGGWGG